MLQNSFEMKPTIGETALDKLIANMEPILNIGDYVFVTLPDIAVIPRSMTVAEVKEKEGVTAVLSKQNADALGLAYNYVASWITLNIHSSLHAVGLTAAFATELSKHNISCNVIAGYYHDHIFVDKLDAERALAALGAMSFHAVQKC
jgi:uncharacterized protein